MPDPEFHFPSQSHAQGELHPSDIDRNASVSASIHLGKLNEQDIVDLEKASGKSLFVEVLRSGRTGHDLDDK